MPLGTMGTRQACPNCGFGPNYPFEIKELVSLHPTYRPGAGVEECEIAEIFRKICCRNCGYIIGLDDDSDSLQQRALAYEEDSDDEEEGLTLEEEKDSSVGIEEQAKDARKKILK